MNQQEREQLNQVNKMVDGLEGMVNNLHTILENHFKNISPEAALKLNDELKKQNVSGIVNEIKKQYDGFKNL